MVMNTEQRLKKQLEHLQKNHPQNPEAVRWMHEIKGKLNTIRLLKKNKLKKLNPYGWNHG